jgi:drug/metabolite transporter (DMT)-like permease
MKRRRLRDVVPMFVPALAGIALMAISIFDPRDDAFSSGRGVVFASGCVFFLAGVAVAAQNIQDTRWRNVVQTCAGTLLLGGFGFVALSIFVFAGDSSPDQVWETRIVGGIASLALAGLTGLGMIGVVKALRGLKDKPESPDSQ